MTYTLNMALIKHRDIVYLKETPYTLTVSDEPQKDQLVLISTKLDKNQYTKLKKQCAGVIYRPDFKDTEKAEADIRYMIEKGYCDYVVGLEQSPDKDFMHQKNGQFNTVIAKLAKQHNIILIFDFSYISKHLQKSVGRVTQTMQLCDKYSVSYFLATFAKQKIQLRNQSDLRCFLRVLR
ncbi:MAG: hypothetical protein ACI8Y7_000304 [Candidatus Woesearchaeota archaeon]|jgi:hypothetical protein